LNNIQIRSAALDDLGVLLEFEQAIIEAERPFDPTIREGEDVHYYDLAALISSSDAEVVVATIDGEIIASGSARIDPSSPYLKHDRHCYLGFMYVVPEHRGKGVNKKILEALEHWSRSRGVNELRLEVYDSNGAAIRAYEKCGFEKLVILMRKSFTGDPPTSESGG